MTTLSLLGMYLPGKTSPEEFQKAVENFLSKEEIDSLTHYAGKALEITSPLAKVVTLQQLETLLPLISQELAVYSLKTLPEMSKMMMKGGLQKLLGDMNERAYVTFFERVRNKVDLLGPDNFEKFMASMESSQEFEKSILRTAVSGNLFDLSLAYITQDAVFASVLKSVLVGILLDMDLEWKIEAIPILVDAFDDHMTEIEDIFLVQGQVDDEEETVSLEQVWKSLGI